MKNVTHQEVAEFTRNMAKFMNGGLSVLNALDAAAACTYNSSTAALIKDIRREMERGQSFSEACSVSAGHLDDICRAIAEAGENQAQQGLVKAMEIIARYQEDVKPHLSAEIDHSRDPTDVTPLEASLFLRILKGLLDIEFGLQKALVVMSSSNSNEPIRILSARILAEIESGNSFLDALKVFPEIFDASALRLIRLGEESLPLMVVALGRAAEYKASLAAGLPDTILTDDVATFLDRLAVMMELKVSLNDALREAAEDYTYNPGMRDLIVHLNHQVGSGLRFSEACASHPEFFDAQSVSSFAAGEDAGSPQNFITLLRHVADVFEQRAKDESPDINLLGTSVFISHSSKNRDVIEERLVAPLEDAGISCWYAKDAIKSASEWERGILKGLEHCEWYLIAMSAEALESEWVKDELFWAVDHRPNRIVPVVLDDCDPAEFHIRMRRLQVIELAPDSEQALREIIRALRQV